jgi:hypothetical protein
MRGPEGNEGELAEFIIKVVVAEKIRVKGGIFQA